MNNLARDVCRIVGHDIGGFSFVQVPFEMITILDGTCARCTSTKSVRIKYIDMHVRGFSVIEKAKDRLKEKFAEREVARKDL